MSSDDESFSTAMRGYNRDEVDNAVQGLRRELIKANNDKAEANKEVKRLKATAPPDHGKLDELCS